MTMMVTSTYEELVARGREAREQADDMQWVEGDLALQVEALSGNQRPRDPETGDFLVDEVKALKRYAEDVDINYRTLQAYRLTAERWPVRARAAASWRVHYNLAAQEDRFDLIRDEMTVSAAEKLVRSRTAGNAGKPGWQELLGRVGDDLAAAAKDMDKLEATVDREPNDRMQEKLTTYAEWARLLAERFDAMREWREVKAA